MSATVRSSDRWGGGPSRDGDGDGAPSVARLLSTGTVEDVVEEGRLELSHVRRILDEITSSRFDGELDSWSQRRYDSLCQLERALLGLQT